MKTRLRLWANNSGGRDDLRTLVTGLGGNASLPALYDLRRGLTAGSNLATQWDDARGASGFAPSLIASGTGRPTFDPAALTLTFNGTANFMTTAANALFDLSGAYTIFLVAALPTSATAAESLGVSNGTRKMSIRNVASTLLGVMDDAAGHSASANSTIAVSATRRLVLVSKSATTNLSIDVPSHARVSATNGGNMPSGTNTLTLGDTFSGAGNFAKPVVRACGALNRQATAADIATLQAWAVSVHQAVLA